MVCCPFFAPLTTRVLQYPSFSSYTRETEQWLAGVGNVSNSLRRILGVLAQVAGLQYCPTAPAMAAIALRAGLSEEVTYGLVTYVTARDDYSPPTRPAATQAMVLLCVEMAAARAGSSFAAVEVSQIALLVSLCSYSRRARSRNVAP